MRRRGPTRFSTVTPSCGAWPSMRWGRSARRPREAVPALRAALQDPVNWVRVWAAAAVAKVTNERSAVAALVAEQHAPQAFVRSLVACHLGRLGANFPGI